MLERNTDREDDMLGVPISEMSGWDSVNQMYRDMYKGQIFNRKTSFGVKWRAIRSLWLMRKFKSESNASLTLAGKEG
jgi:hypothetical protein